MAERLALPTSDHGVAGSNPAGGEILPEPKRRFIAQSLSCSPFHRLEMTEILLKGRKTLTHPSIHPTYVPTPPICLYTYPTLPFSLHLPFHVHTPSTLLTILYLCTRATEILKSKSVRSTDDVIDVIRTCIQQSQIVTKTNDSSFSSKSVSEIDYFSNTL